MISQKRMAIVLGSLVRSYQHFVIDTYGIGNNYSPRVNRESMSHYGSEPMNHYGFVPSDVDFTMVTLILLYDHIRSTSDRFIDRSISFLDIGCGIGNVVRLAEVIGFSAYGLEYNKKIYEVAKRFVCVPNAIKKGNMLTFKGYHKYDVLYYYQPICSNGIMSNFANKLAREMKVGAYVVPHGSNPFKDIKSFKKIPSSGYQIYKKIAEVQK